MTTQLNIKVDKELKKNVEKVFKQLGINTTEAGRIFFKKVEQEKGIPFDLKLSDQDDSNNLNEKTKKQL